MSGTTLNQHLYNVLPVTRVRADPVRILVVRCHWQPPSNLPILLDRAARAPVWLALEYCVHPAIATDVHCVSLQTSAQVPPERLYEKKLWRCPLPRQLPARKGRRWRMENMCVRVIYVHICLQ